MKLIAAAILCIYSFASCSKKNDVPSGSTNATVTITYPDGRSQSFTDFSVKGGSAGYMFDNQNSGGNVPIDYIDDVNASPDFYIYRFSGYKPNGLYQLNFGTPPQTIVQNFTEDLSQGVTVSGMTANSFIFTFQDTAYTPSVLQVSVSGSPNGSFQIAFNIDSVGVRNAEIAYPKPGLMTITGNFNNVSLIN